jgi:hypothetical protein
MCGAPLQVLGGAGGGLVVCVQPHAGSARHVAHQLAEEFDGAPLGHSVGLETGQEVPVRGRLIMVVTTGIFLRWVQRDPKLAQIAVLIMDEVQEGRCVPVGPGPGDSESESESPSRMLQVAFVLFQFKLARASRGHCPGPTAPARIPSLCAHARVFVVFWRLALLSGSMETDVALGVAKLAAAARLGLRVIVACSGVDPTPFLRHFGLSGPALPLLGPQFPVSVHHSPLPPGAFHASPDSFVRDHVLPLVVRALVDHAHGNAVVYLPGREEVLAAVQAWGPRSVGRGGKDVPPPGVVPVALVDGTMGAHVSPVRTRVFSLLRGGLTRVPCFQV